MRIDIMLRLKGRPQVIRALVLVTGLACTHLLGGCSQPPATPETAAGKPGEAHSEPIQVIYDERLSPDRLTPAQLAELVKGAKPATMAGLKIWYIHVHDNSIIEGKAIWNATVFFKPDSSTGRIRKGKCQRDGPGALGSGCLFDYVQVSLPGEPFGEKLEPPPPRLWPFMRPEGFSDEEIIEIVDFARTSPGDFNGKEPIHFINRQKDGVIEAESGSQQHPLAGFGTGMTCIKKDGEWVVLKTWSWVS